MSEACQMCHKPAAELCRDGNCRACHVSCSWEDCNSGAANARLAPESTALLAKIKATTTATRMTRAQWLARGAELFGRDMKKWRWVCVACGNIQSAESCLANNPRLDLQSTAGWMYFACEGRHTKSRGCNWSLGGLFHIHERVVIDDEGDEIPVFLFDGEAGDITPGYTPRQLPATKERPHDKI